MKEIPILFSTPMVQAILDGRKTMTRRTRGLEETNQHPDKNLLVGKYHILTDSRFEAIFHNAKTDEKIESKCYYGLPGDMLWVRETFSPPMENQRRDHFYYKADFSIGISEHKKNRGFWKPSIHMPKAAARIWLQVEEIKVERLHKITKEDAIAEGAQPLINTFPGINNYKDIKIPNYRTGFMKIWIKINGEKSWKANPWVWVVKFKVLSTTGKPQL